MTKHVFRIEVEVGPMEGTQLPSDCAGAFVNVFLGADEIRAAIDTVEKQLLADRYRPVSVYAAFALDLEGTDYDTDEEGYPGNDDLSELQANGGLWYGPFNCFPPEDQETEND